MKFSIVTPVLNGAAYLAAAIASVRGQSHLDFEHLIIDGGSTDGSLDIAGRAAAADARLRVIEAPGLSQYAAIARGFDEAGGEVFAWLNADDLYAPWALSAIARKFNDEPSVGWLTGLPGCWDADGVLRFVRAEGARPRMLIRHGWFHKDLLGFIQQESVFFRASLYRGLPAPDRAAFASADLAGDFILWKRLARSAPLDVLPTAISGFRVHGANRSVRGIDAYMAEIRRDGAVFLPWPLAGLARRLYWLIAGGAALRLARREDARLG